MPLTNAELRELPAIDAGTKYIYKMAEATIQSISERAIQGSLEHEVTVFLEDYVTEHHISIYEHRIRAAYPEIKITRTYSEDKSYYAMGYIFSWE